MTIVTDTQTQTATVTFDNQEWATLDEILSRQTQALQTLIVDWLKNRRAQIVEQDRKAIQDRIASISPAQIRQLKQLLGI